MLTMKKRIWFLAFLLIFLPSLSLRAIDVKNTVPPFQVLSQDGEPPIEQDLRDKITILFYDTRHTVPVNNDLKYEINDFRKANLPLLENLQVIQVIDASSANFLTRIIWKRKLRQNARKYGVNLYADWTGTMRQSLHFSTKESNILVIDPRGTVRHNFFGKVAENEKERLSTLALSLGKENKKQT